MMKHYGSKLLALLLCMMTVIGLMPVTAFADNSTEATPGQLTVKNAGFEEFTVYVERQPHKLPIA